MATPPRRASSRYQRAIQATVDRSDVPELYFMAPRDNLASLLVHGILSFRRAARVPHLSVAMEVIQDVRDDKRVPGGMRLHEYANLYFCARNPMMYRISRTLGADALVVLAINPDVLDDEGVVVTDGNAASGYTRFATPSRGLGLIDHAYLHAERWDRHDDQRDYWRHKAAKCAEVLVPSAVEPDRICRILVASTRSETLTAPIAGALPIAIAPYTFFAGPR